MLVLILILIVVIVLVLGLVIVPVLGLGGAVDGAAANLLLRFFLFYYITAELHRFSSYHAQFITAIVYPLS